MFKKNDSVEVKNGDTLYQGMIASVSRGMAKVVLFDQTNRQVTVPVNALSACSRKIPDDHPFFATYGKGQAVLVTMKDGEKKGVVTKGVSRPGVTRKVGVALLGDGDGEYSVPVTLLRKGDFETEARYADDSPMKRWSVTAYKRYKMGHDGEIFDAKICLDGKPVLMIENDGHGGPDNVYSIKADGRETEKRFFADVDKWEKSLTGRDKATEPWSSWFDWYCFQRVAGVTEKQYFDAMMARYKELGIK